MDFEKRNKKLAIVPFFCNVFTLDSRNCDLLRTTVLIRSWDHKGHLNEKFMKNSTKDANCQNSTSYG